MLAFSAGALNGAACFFGAVGELEAQWRQAARRRVFKLSPRLRPLSLLSPAPLLDVILRDLAGAERFGGDEEAAKLHGRCELTVMALRPRDGQTVYSRFTPKGAGGWDGPMALRLAASCAIPLLFPPVRIEEGGRLESYIDGGIPGRAWMSLDALAGCRDIVVLEMVRPEEVGTRRWLPWLRMDQAGREVCREQVSRAISSAGRWPERPRVFRLFPSCVLDFTMLSFRSPACRLALDLGLADGRAFLAGPAPWLVGWEDPAA